MEESLRPLFSLFLILKKKSKGKRLTFKSDHSNTSAGLSYKSVQASSSHWFGPVMAISLLSRGCLCSVMRSAARLHQFAGCWNFQQ